MRDSEAKIEAVAKDMSRAYCAAVQKNIPNAKQVFDRFHIVKLMNEKLDKLRREVQNDRVNLKLFALNEATFKFFV